MKQIRQVTSGAWQVTNPVTHHASRIMRRAFSLIEIMIVMALLSVIVIGLMAMFGQVQKAFLGSVTQTDVLESGRATTELLARELTGIVPSYQSNVTNFYADILSFSHQSLPGGVNGERTNVLERLYFLTRENQQWQAYGYYFDGNGTNGVAALYRWYAETNVSQNPARLYENFIKETLNPTQSHRVIDGVVQFRVRAFDEDGRWIINAPTNQFGTNFIILRSAASVAPAEIGLYAFKSNAVPAYVEFELGVLEKRTYERFKALPATPATVRQNYLNGQAGKTHLFRQRVPVRMVDVNAYQ